MQAVIIEDEKPAAEKLERYLQRLPEPVSVINILQKVSDSVEWLKGNQDSIDIIFMDIQLLDGKSFEIFNQLKVYKPVIFTTAFDEYALEAFKVNSIDYLLKPITYQDLESSINKLKNLKANLPGSQSHVNLNEVLAQLQQKTFKTRFMVKLGEHIRSVATKDVALFYAEGRDVYLVTNENRKFIIDYKLEELDDMLDPKDFYRANRSFILNIEAITDVVVFSNSRLKVFTKIDLDREVIVSREKVNSFKEWFNDQ
ncbi:LytR/AlgR family response regulator transcription factor [Fulvivirga lutea]|uniref:Response regulator transcription factor n=1 Tax=Fulvivirga lutea TaxID=2810512 RepID=A0A974WE92_9BACT|nr:LytTR family DNA-binding domain-containing protein [Fulvivirga lutea]QSE95974.1 response regulator transcription factor [Fulvivirga lutea]